MAPRKPTVPVSVVVAAATPARNPASFVRPLVAGDVRETLEVVAFVVGQHVSRVGIEVVGHDGPRRVTIEDHEIGVAPNQIADAGVG